MRPLHVLLLLLTALNLALVAPAPAQEKKADRPQSGMATRIFRTPPFIAEVPIPVGTPLQDMREILEKAGVPFPPGASAALDPAADLLMVTNTAANLDLVQAVIANDFRPERRLATFLITVVEAPGAVLRQADAAAAASQGGDATSELKHLLAQAAEPASKIRIVGDGFLEAESGTRATFEAGREDSARSALEVEEQGSPASPTYEFVEGLRLHLEPNVPNDGKIIECSLDLMLHSALLLRGQVRTLDPPVGKAAVPPVPEVPSMHFTTQLRGASGHTKLIGMAKPEGTGQEKEDVLWAAFVTATLREQEAETASSIVVLDRDFPNDSTLQTVSFDAPDGLFETLADYPFFQLQDGLLKKFVAESPFSLRKWLAGHGVVLGPGAEVSHHNGVLRITALPLDIARTARLVDLCFRDARKTVVSTVQTFQGPAFLLRDLARQTASSPDDSAMLAAVEAAAAKGEMSRVDFMLFDARLSEHNSVHTGYERRYLARFGTHTNGLPAFQFETRHVDTHLRLEANQMFPGGSLHLTLQHGIDTAAPKTWRDHFLDPATRQTFDLPATDFHTADTITGLSLRPGRSKLLSLHQPVGRDAPGMLWATFLRCDVVPHILPPLPPPPPKPAGVPQVWETRRFRVPPHFLPARSTGDTSRPTARETLEAEQVPFPEGATAVFDEAAAILTVRNTPENLAKVAAYVETLLPNPSRSLVLTTQVLQGPGALLRRLATTTAPQLDHRAALGELLAAVKAGTARHLGTARLKMQSGAEAAPGPINELIAPLNISMNKEGKAVLEADKRPTGFLLQGSALLSPDGRSVELKLEAELPMAGPQTHAEHVILPGGRRLEFPFTNRHLHKISLILSLPADLPRLVSVWKATTPEFAKEDMLQVLVITCDAENGGK